MPREYAIDENYRIHYKGISFDDSSGDRYLYDISQHTSDPNMTSREHFSLAAENARNAAILVPAAAGTLAVGVGVGMFTGPIGALFTLATLYPVGYYGFAGLKSAKAAASHIADGISGHFQCASSPDLPKCQGKPLVSRENRIPAFGM